MSDSKWLAWGCVVVLGLIIVALIAANYAVDKREARDALVYAAQNRWYVAHKCMAEGYVSRAYYEPSRTYRCDDGQLYIWRDIPQQP